MIRARIIHDVGALATIGDDCDLGAKGPNAGEEILDVVFVR